MLSLCVRSRFDLLWFDHNIVWWYLQNDVVGEVLPRLKEGQRNILLTRASRRPWLKHSLDWLWTRHSHSSKVAPISHMVLEPSDDGFVHRHKISYSFSNLLLGLNETNPTSIPLVNDTNFVGFFIAEDVEVMINVVKCENSFLNGDWLTQVKTKERNKTGGKWAF